jgi:hypothetical protein
VGVIELERIIATIEEFNFRAKKCSRALGFILAANFHLFQRCAWFFPRELALAPLAI